jgi:Xaa-Pro aminopeptidase
VTAPKPWLSDRPASGLRPVPASSPGDGAMAVLEGAGRAVAVQGGEADYCVGSLGHGLGSAVVVEVGSGEARVGCVDQDPVKSPRDCTVSMVSAALVAG